MANNNLLLLLVVLLYLHMCQIHCALGCRAYLLVLCEEGAFSGFLLPSCPSALHCLSVGWERCPCSRGGGGGGSWLGCQVLPATSAVYI